MKEIKYLFLIMLATFMSVSSVNAVEISCSTSKNLLKPANFIDGLYKPFDYSPVDVGYYHVSYGSLIPVEPSTTYTYLHDFTTSTSPRRVAIVYYDENYQYLSYINEKTTSSSFKYSFTTLSNSYYITLHLYSANLDTLNSNQYQLSKGSSITEFVDYEECVIEEPEPDIPEEDPVVIPDTTLNDFYSIYLDKLKLLFNYAQENKFLLSFIGIILLFVILEIILILFRKGGYH